jgi:hypothetical protein
VAVAVAEENGGDWAVVVVVVVVVAVAAVVAVAVVRKLHTPEALQA